MDSSSNVKFKLNGEDISIGEVRILPLWRESIVPNLRLKNENSLDNRPLEF